MIAAAQEEERDNLLSSIISLLARLCGNTLSSRSVHRYQSGSPQYDRANDYRQQGDEHRYSFHLVTDEGADNTPTRLSYLALNLVIPASRACAIRCRYASCASFCSSSGFVMKATS